MKRKTRKAKIQAQKRKIQKLTELKELKQKAQFLQEQIAKQKKQYFKNFNLRNAKVLNSTCNFLIPFSLMTLITIGAVDTYGGFLPFKKDKITKYKYYNLEWQTNSYQNIQEEYIYIFDYSPDNNLILYTPWKYENNQYTRLKKEFNPEKLNSLDLYNAVLSENYELIEELLNSAYFEEKQVTNILNEPEDNQYFLKAKLNYLDLNDFITYDESNLDNFLITMGELVIILGVSGVINHLRKFDYLKDLKKINEEYQNKIKSYQDLKIDYETVKQRIITLEKTTGVRR